MKIHNYLTALAAAGAVGFVCTARAQTMDQSNPNQDNDQTTVIQTQPDEVIVTNRPPRYYRKHEISFDGFGTLLFGDEKYHGNYIHHQSALGAGAGVNVFFTRNIGVGADAWSEDTTHRFIDNTSGSLIFRWPIQHTCLAPYVFGGGGYEFERTPQGFGQVGGGIEARVTPHIGVFVDARYIVGAKSDNFGLGRAGIRLSF